MLGGCALAAFGPLCVPQAVAKPPVARTLSAPAADAQPGDADEAQTLTKPRAQARRVCTRVDPGRSLASASLQNRANAVFDQARKTGFDIHIDEPAALLDGGADAAAQGSADPGERTIAFDADTLEYHQDTDIVTASGNVEMESEGERLRADKVVWNRKTGDVTAEGNVRIIDKQGNRFYGDSIMLNETLRDGVIDNILIVMEAGGRLVARRATREHGIVTLEDTAYTPCTVEYSNGDPKNPSWQVKAVRITYDPQQQRVSYDGARLELFGLPLIPLPGLSHPVGEGGDSGFLVPNIRYSEANGAELEVPYYFNLAENRDLTVTGTFYTQTLPMIAGKYRALVDKGAYQIEGYATVSERIRIAGRPVPLSDQDIFRGYIDASGRFQLDPHWSFSASIRRASDRTFLRRYDISRDDRLRSNITAERIDKNSYFSLVGWATQTLRVNDPQGQVPVALPVMDWRWRPDGEIAGGRASVQLNTLAIVRTDGQDTQRGFAQARWDMDRILPTGQLLTLTALARGDIYHTSDTSLTNTVLYRGEEGVEGRFHATFAADVKWPFIGNAFGGTQILTPRMQLVATPVTDSGDLPNEDARAIELQDSNLFALNRLPGYDLIEDGVRLVYGFDWELRIPELTINTSFGQSYSLNNREAFIPDGTGIPERFSDFVGRTDIRYKDFLKFTHRFRLDKDSLEIRRNEVDATIGDRESYFQLGYLRYNRNISAAIEDLRDREEVRMAARYKFWDYWSVFGSAVVDLSNSGEDPSLTSDGFEPVRTRLGIGYDDDCIALRFTWRRDYFATGDAELGNTFLFRIAFRSLGL